MAESQLLVVNAQQVHACRVKIVDVHLVFNDAESELVSRSIGQPSFHPASSHPDTEALFVVITAGRGQLTRASIVLLHHRSTSKLSAPNDQGVVQQITLLQILNQRCTCLVDFPNRTGQCGIDVRMMIPALRKYLNESNTFLNQSARLQTIASEARIGIGTPEHC